MILDTDGTKPIYVQIAEWLETEIMTEHIADDEKVYSQYQLAEMFNVNPATAAKALNVLADEGIVYKKRGLGMFVAQHAKDGIRKKRREQTLQRLVAEVVSEARQLHVGEAELIAMIRESMQHRGGDDE